MTTRVTLPTYQAIRHSKMAVTSFAVDCVNPADRDAEQITYNFYRNAEGRYEYGRLWLREHGDDTTNALAYDLTSQGPVAVNVTNQKVAVAPLIEHPEQMGLTVLNYHGRTVLGYNQQVLTYPNRRTNQATSQKLTGAYIGSDPDLQLLGGYSWPQFTLTSHRIKPVTHQCFAYQGHHFVRVAEESGTTWYLCEPVPVAVQPDGSLQCLEGLFRVGLDDIVKMSHHVGRHEINTDTTALGVFLNQEFLPELMANGTRQIAVADQKLSKLQADLAWDKLKKQISDTTTINPWFRA